MSWHRRGVAAGIVIGGVAAWLATRWVTPFLFGLTASDPATWAIAALVLAAAALGAGALPAWQAARVDPIAALRTD